MKPNGKKTAVPRKNWITFNVAGSYFSTSRLTLTKRTPTSSPLHRVSNGSTNVEWDRDETGAYMIDRDPLLFQALLNYLRSGYLVLGNNISEEGVLYEAEYFNVPDLVKLIRQKIVERQSRMLVQPFAAQRPHSYYHHTETF